MHSRGLPVAHAAVAVVGVVLLVWAAMPLKWDGLVENHPARGWILVVGWAVACGVIGGAVEGLAARSGHPRIAIGVLLAASFLGGTMPVFALGRWLDGGTDYVMESANLFQPIVGWLLFIALITLVAYAVAGRRSRPPQRARRERSRAAPP